jgi:hypothetical protein
VSRVARFAASAAVTGAACFAVAFLAHTTDPWTLLGVLAAGLLCLGGRLATWQATSAMRIACGALAVLVVRVAWGPMPALLVAILLLVGAALRVRPADLRYGLAVVGMAVAVIGRARVDVLVAFWLLGVLLKLAWRAVTRARLWLRARRVEHAPAGAGVTVIWS